VLGRLGFIGVAAKECGCASPEECALFPEANAGPVDPDEALRVGRVKGSDCRR
jgi:hypothetical protein